MNKITKSFQDGFTLIEIIVVIAIAGLIMGLVFTSISGSQKARRDQARKTDVNKLAAAVEAYTSNNNGSLPANGWNGASYWTSSGVNTYTFATLAVATAPTLDAITFMTAQKCDSTAGSAGKQVANAGSKNWAISVGLEQGAYCIDNS